MKTLVGFGANPTECDQVLFCWGVNASLVACISASLRSCVACVDFDPVVSALVSAANVASVSSLRVEEMLGFRLCVRNCGRVDVPFSARTM